MVFKSDKHTMAGYSNGSQSPERLNRIVEGTHIEGDIKSDSNIRIDGYVKGIISCKYTKNVFYEHFTDKRL